MNVPVLTVNSRSELGLADYAAAVWQYRRVVAGLALALASAGVAVSSLQKPRYESSAIISVAGSKLSGTSAPRFGPESMLPVLERPTVVQAALRSTGHEELAAFPDRFIRRRLDVEYIRRTELIEVRVRMPDASAAARVVNAIAERAFVVVREGAEREVATLERQLTPLVTQAEERMQEASRALRDYRRMAQVEVLRQDITTQLSARDSLEKVELEIERVRARFAGVQRERDARKEYDRLSQTLVRSPLLVEAVRSQGEGNAVTNLSLTNELVNDVYRRLDEAVATARTELSSLESQRGRLLRHSAAASDSLPRLIQLYEREATLQRLQQEHDLARKALNDATERYQGARLAALAATPQLTVLEPGTPPAEPLPRHRARNAAIGLVFGGALGILYAFSMLAIPRLQ